MGLLDFLSPKKKREELINRLLGETRIYFEEAKNKMGFTPIATSILLNKDEDAYLQEESTLHETKAIRYHQRSGMGFRIMKGVYVGGGGGTSENKEEWRIIDDGTLILTNKRLIFDGSKEDRVIPLSKIISVKHRADAVEISSTNRKKTMLLKVNNPFTWEIVIQLLNKIESPKQLKKMDIITDVESKTFNVVYELPC